MTVERDPATLCHQLERLGCVTPALVIDLDTVAANIAAVLARVGDPRRWRPHVKTVKQAAIVRLLLDAGVRHFKCATLPELSLVLATADEAAVAVDVLLAHPLPQSRFPELLALAQAHRRAQVGVLVDAPEVLARWPDGADAIARWLDVDVGMHRTGTAASRWLDWLDRHGRSEIAGLHGYEGHLGFDDRDTAFAGYDALVELAQRHGGLAYVTTSGSHAIEHALAHAGLTSGPWQHQVGAGTLVLSDLASTRPAAAIGVIPAAFVAARVIARPTPDRITLDAGSKAISPDRPPPSCAVVGYPGLVPGKASEEHLPLRVTAGEVPERGAIVLLVPDHVCTTVNLHREAIHVRDGSVCGFGEIEAAGRERPLPHWSPPCTTAATTR
ncbi:MAG: alanine racemase [Deltaproteobacteria bacterium]|nr:alanine racemase [Deltaproteobacteria bacterium]MBP7288810.1 alanine racemase [Nannocystaceae bacterium]